MIRVLLADSIEINRLGFRCIVEGSHQCASIDEVSTEYDLINNLRSFDYDLVVVDPLVAETTGEILLRRIRSTCEDCKILVLTSMSEAIFGLKALRCGVRGYVLKSCSPDELAAAVTRVSRGGVHISTELAEIVAKSSKHPSTRPLHEFLSDREFQVFSLLVCGRKVIEIANALSLSAKTISTHKLRIFQKLHVDSITEIVKYAISQDLLEACRIRCNNTFGHAAHSARRTEDTRGNSVLPEPAVGKHTGTSRT